MLHVSVMAELFDGVTVGLSLGVCDLDKLLSGVSVTEGVDSLEGENTERLIEKVPDDVTDAEDNSELLELLVSESSFVREISFENDADDVTEVVIDREEDADLSNDKVTVSDGEESAEELPLTDHVPVM